MTVSRWPRSLAFRLMIVSGMVSILALVLTGLMLNGLFLASTERQIDDLQFDDKLHIESALAFDDTGTLALTTPLETPLFVTPGSGWIWQVWKDGRVIAQSASLPDGALIDAPLQRHGYYLGPGGAEMRGGAWPITIGGDDSFVLALGLPRAEIDRQVGAFRRAMMTTLLVLGVLLAVATFVQVRLGLSQLADLSRSIGHMRVGAPPPRAQDWPVEIAPLVEEVGALVDHNAALVARARHDAADLAHSLKTPLAVLQSLAEDATPALRSDITQQTHRMDHAIRRSRSRSSTGGTVWARTQVRPVVDDLIMALDRLFRDRSFRYENRIPEGTAFFGDLADLDEMLGNLMENAAKWTVSTIIVSAENADEPDRIIMTVEDDGPGIAPEDVERVLHRGMRLDETVDGQGIGLAIVSDVVSLYRGSFWLQQRRPRGTAACLDLPGQITD